MNTSAVPFVGEIAGLGTACCWSLCSLAFAFAGKRIGAMAVNQLRIPMAVVLLGAMHLILFGEFWPHAATSGQVFWLALSGLLGLALGDLFLFRCFVLIGPRLGHILMTTAPVMTVLLAWPILDETQGRWSVVGIAITVGGVMTVLADRHGNIAWESPAGSKTRGILMGFLGAVGQAGGLVTAKLGMMAAAGTAIMSAGGGESMAEPLDPLSATLLRMIAGAISIWVIATLRGGLGATFRAVRNRRALWITFVGAALGPFLGVWLSLVSVTYTKAGIAATLMATAPILMLPLARVAYGDRPGRAAVLGTFIAVLGVACLFLTGGS